MRTMRLVDAFIAELARSAATPQQAFADVLWARGFLVERHQGALILTDNAHGSDYVFLHEELARANLGEVEGTRLAIREGVEPGGLAPLFKRFGGWEAYHPPQWSRWRNFRNRVHGPKVPVRVLEPFIAALVKAVNAIGLGTCSAGDGDGRNEMTVYFTGVYHTAWFAVLLDTWLTKNLSLACEWRIDKQGRLQIRHPGRNVVRLYTEAVSVAKALYEQRKTLRELKQKVAWTLDSRVQEMSTYEDAYQLMCDEARRQNTSAPL